MIGDFAMLYGLINADFNKLTCILSNSIFQTPWYSFLLSMLVVFHFLRMNKVWDHQNVSPYKIESCKSRHHQCWCLPLWNKLTWKLELRLLQILLYTYALSLKNARIHVTWIDNGHYCYQEHECWKKFQAHLSCLF